MKTLELFAGTKSFSKVAEKLGHETFTIDIDYKLKPDMVADLNVMLLSDILAIVEDMDIVWLSPPCTTFSMASGNTHWTADRKPKTENAKNGLEMLRLCEYIANYCIQGKKLFFIENPRARARWFLPVEWRKTAWYCQYGHKNAKPTDIWTNLKEWTPKTCHNGNPDHEAAPRGSKTGTQGLKGAKARGVIPPKLFEEIFGVINERLNESKNV